MGGGGDVVGGFVGGVGVGLALDEWQSHRPQVLAQYPLWSSFVDLIQAVSQLPHAFCRQHCKL